MVSCALFMDVASLYFVFLSIPIIKKERELSSSEISPLGAAFYFGSFFGFIIHGIIADILGRRQTILLDFSIELISLLLLISIERYSLMLFFRFMIGVGKGHYSSACYILTNEITIARFRGRSTMLIQLYGCLGKLYFLVLANIFMDNFEQGDWKATGQVIIVLEIFVLLGLYILIDESPRYLLAIQSDIKGAIQILNQMIRQNGGSLCLSQFDILHLSEWSEKLKKQSDYTLTEKFKLLWIKGKYSTTMRFWIICIIHYFIYSGNQFIIPFVLERFNISIRQLTIASTSQLFSIFIMYFIIDNPNFKRKFIFSFVTLLKIITFMIIFIAHQSFILIGLSMIFFIQKFIWSLIFPLISENYQTINRSLGYGLALSIGQLSSSISPFISYPIYEQYSFDVYLLFSILGCVMLLSIATLPQDKTSKDMDKLSEIENSQIFDSDNEKEIFDAKNQRD